MHCNNKNRVSYKNLCKENMFLTHTVDELIEEKAKLQKEYDGLKDRYAMAVNMACGDVGRFIAENRELRKEVKDLEEQIRMLINSVYGLPCGWLNLKTIDHVIFIDPATIVFWKDGTKTVVKNSDRKKFDPEKGLAMAICKKLGGNKGSYYDEFKKWLPKK